MKRRKKIVFILAGMFFLAGILAFGHFFTKMKARARLRQEAMSAYENGDLAGAKRLLHKYVEKNPDAEEQFVALAHVYHEIGNSEMEAQMWKSASALNPRKPEYRENMLNNAVKSANYSLLHGILGWQAKTDGILNDQELYLYVISSFRAGYPNDGIGAYSKAVEADPEVFHKNDLGRMAEFMAKYDTWSGSEIDVFLNDAMQSDDPIIRFEALYYVIRNLERNNDESQYDEELERRLKQAMEANYLAGTALLADFYYSKYRFTEAIEILEPYLRIIDDVNLYLLYAECCFFEGKLDEIKALKKKMHQGSGILPFVGDYCDVLIAFLENNEERLVAAVRQSNRRVDSPLSRFIRLRVAITSKSFDEIRNVAQEVFTNPPFYDLNNRATLICLNYVSEEMKKPENQKDPSRMADLARILSGYLHGNRLLTEILLVNQQKKGLVKEEDLLAALEMFPDDPLLRRITAEFLIFQGKAEEALPIVEQILDAGKTAGQQPDREVQILLMLALDQTGRHDEAAEVFRDLVVRFGFAQDLLEPYFHFCVNNRRAADLIFIADRMDASEDENLKQSGRFFRATAQLMTGDKSKEQEALDLLASTSTDDIPDFTFYAANLLCRHNRLDDAEKKYTSILKTYRTPSLPYVNLSIVYHAKGEDQKALEAAKTAYELEKESLFPTFVYAKRLSEAKRYAEAVNVLHFPRHAVDYREDIVDLWRECMYHVIEESIAGRKILQAEEQCRHLLIVIPDDETGKEYLEKVRSILFMDSQEI